MNSEIRSVRVPAETQRVRYAVKQLDRMYYAAVSNEDTELALSILDRMHEFLWINLNHYRKAKKYSYDSGIELIEEAVDEEINGCLDSLNVCEELSRILRVERLPSQGEKSAED